MMKDLMKMVDSNQDDDMQPEDRSAKTEMLMELIKMASKAAGEDIKKGMDGMKEVSVMAPDQEGLKEGLELAEDVVEEESDLMPEDGMEMEEMEDDAEMSPEEIEAEIQRLMEMKKSKQMMGE